MQKSIVENIKGGLDEELNDLRDKESFYRRLVQLCRIGVLRRAKS